MRLLLELVPVPVNDVDAAIAFYRDGLGFVLDHDVRPADGVRVVQLTPPGSACSIGLGTGLPVYGGTPGSQRGLHLVVDDLDEIRAALLARGVVVGEVHDLGGGVRGASLSDPDGNTWELQELAWRRTPS